MNFCSTLGCISNRVVWGEIERPHLQHNDPVKLQNLEDTNSHRGQFGKTFREAREVLKNARAFFKSSSDGTERWSRMCKNRQDVFNSPLCSACKKLASQPCWCSSCKSFIWWECDAKSKDDPSLKFEKHDTNSWVQELVEEKDLSIDEISRSG
jgi:hypothetical protein